MNLTLPFESFARPVNVWSNVAPKDTHDMVNQYLHGNRDVALQLQLKYIDLIAALFSEVNPIPVKAAANIMGYNVGGLRLPLTEIEDEHRQKLESEMKKVGLI